MEEKRDGERKGKGGGERDVEAGRGQRGQLGEYQEKIGRRYPTTGYVGSLFLRFTFYFICWNMKSDLVFVHDINRFH